MRKAFQQTFTFLFLGIAFCCAASAQAIKVTLLGTGYPQPRMDRFGPSTLVEAGGLRLLFDCGRGCSQRLESQGTGVAGVSVIFFTHLHSDHIVGFPDLWLTGWIAGRETPMQVFGPEGTEAMAAHLTQAYGFDIHIRRDVDEKLQGEGWKLTAKDIEPGVVFQNDGVKVTAIAVDHGPVKPAFGYRVDYAGHSVVLSGDTRFCENLIASAQGTDVLIHEVMSGIPASPPAATTPAATLSAATTPSGAPVPASISSAMAARVQEHHTSPEQAAIVFSRVKPKLAVYYHVIGSEQQIEDVTRKGYSGPFIVGSDLMEIDIGDHVEVRRLGPDAKQER